MFPILSQPQGSPSFPQPLPWSARLLFHRHPCLEFLWVTLHLATGPKKKKKIWLGFWLSSPSSHLPPSLPGGMPGRGMCWAVWEEDWNVHIAQMGIEVWPSPWSILPHLPLLLLQLSFFHPEEPEKRFPIWFRGWVLTSMRGIYICYSNDCRWGPSLQSVLSKEDFLEDLFWEPSTHTMYPLTHSFIISKNIFMCLWHARHWESAVGWQNMIVLSVMVLFVLELTCPWTGFGKRKSLENRK